MTPSPALWCHRTPCASITSCPHHPSSSSSSPLHRATKTEVFWETPETRLRPLPNSLHQWGQPALLPPTKPLTAEPGAGGSGWVGGSHHRVLPTPRSGWEGLGAMRRHAGTGGLVLAPQSRTRSLPHGFTKPVLPAGPREGGSGRESQAEGRDAGHCHLPGPALGCTQRSCFCCWGMLEGDAPVWVWGRRFCFTPITHRTSCPHPRG